MEVDAPSEMMGKSSIESEGRLPASIVGRCVLVAGMHRSGTSAVCGVLAQLGLQRALRELPPQPDNPKGFFEPKAIVEVHDKILAELGRKWDDCRSLPRDWQEKNEIKELICDLKKEFMIDFPIPGTPFVKDPRMCLLLKAWNEIILDCGYKPLILITFRRPLEVARSLQERNGISEKSGLLIWLRYVLESERNSREQDRHFILYDQTQFHAAHIQQLMTGASIATLELPAGEHKEFFDRSLRHHYDSSTNNEFISSMTWQINAFTALLKLSESPFDKESMDRLDNIYGLFEEALSNFEPILSF